MSSKQVNNKQQVAKRRPMELSLNINGDNSLSIGITSNKTLVYSNNIRTPMGLKEKEEKEKKEKQEKEAELLRNRLYWNQYEAYDAYYGSESDDEENGYCGRYYGHESDDEDIERVNSVLVSLKKGIASENDFPRYKGAVRK